jgi:uncharacterized membrane protein YeaQ/YmgE (transglycosylase-associated protein family)
MGLLTMIIVGAFAGWVASIIMRTNAQMGWLANIIVGILGSVLGGFIVNLLRGDVALTTGFLNFNPLNIIVSILGAVLLIGILRFFRKESVL